MLSLVYTATVTLCDASKGGSYGDKILYKNLIFSTRFSCQNLAVEDFVTLAMGKKSC